MKLRIGFVFGLLILSAPIFAQVSPRPVADQEMRDNSSIRMRSIQLERAKQDSRKVFLPQLTREQTVKLSEITEDFENIQKLQDKIVKTYTTGKTINYGKIADAAASMSKKAVRLDVNLFGAKPSDNTASPTPSKPKSVRDLIIDLDNAIRGFIDSPVFSSGKVVDTNQSKESELALLKVIKISETLAVESRKRQ